MPRCGLNTAALPKKFKVEKEVKSSGQMVPRASEHACSANSRRFQWFGAIFDVLVEMPMHLLFFQFFKWQCLNMHVKTALLKKLTGRLNSNVQPLGESEHACSETVDTCSDSSFPWVLLGWRCSKPS